jgi:demethylmenaquinone methyltransferase/2-methoxy-6-polyprenyl-1,4-benzoquinol methylase
MRFAKNASEGLTTVTPVPPLAPVPTLDFERFLVNTKIQKMFTRIAGTYDELNHKLSLGKDKGWRKAAAAMLLKDGHKPHQVLDLCAGTGDMTLALVTDDMDCKATLVDFSREMLKLARSKTRGVQGRVTILEADAAKLPFQDMSFDAVLCGFGVRNMENPEAGLREISRVLKPGGRLVVLDFFKPEGGLMTAFYKFYMNFVVAKVGASISKDPDAYTYLPTSAKNFVTVDDFAKLMEKCRFKQVESEKYTAGIAASVMGTR